MPCDHPKCSDEQHKTYRDENDNELELCEAHYYYLVSGETKPRTRPVPDFDPVSPDIEEIGVGRPRDVGRQLDR